MAPVRRREEKQMEEEEEEEEVKGPYAVVLKKDPFGRVCVCCKGVGRLERERHITRRTKVLSDTKGKRDGRNKTKKKKKKKRREKWRRKRKIDLIIIYSILYT
jgi:hypothetical protein